MQEIDNIKQPLAEKEQNFWIEIARIKREQMELKEKSIIDSKTKIRCSLCNGNGVY